MEIPFFVASYLPYQYYELFSNIKNEINSTEPDIANFNKQFDKQTKYVKNQKVGLALPTFCNNNNHMKAYKVTAKLCDENKLNIENQICK